ncbi:MAG: phage terminase small subunit P27 family [Candidatus Obscuribacterales bacterium]|nr:phage terminase small subunit P27 family [Candidatus Obscuribacterales bacterium]
MARPGPIPKSRALKERAGNPGKRRLPNEPKPATGDLSCPSWMPTEGKKEWARIVPELQRLGVATQIDQSQLELYCGAWATWLDAQKKLAKEGAVLMRPTGSFYANPYVKIAADASKEIQSIAKEFGLTPSSRTRVDAGSTDSEEDSDDDAEFFS